MARRPALAIGLTILWTFLVSSLPALLYSHPRPYIHDEFGYLLGADTFVHGRLANPPHPMWQHFETMHEIFRPTYASKFPAGLSVALAVGQLLGDPLIGAWLALAAGCGALCWALRAWLPPTWALMVTMLAAIHPRIFHWGQSYWGGCVTLIGGALLAGAVARWFVCRHRSVRLGIIAGVALGMLAWTRPFEGTLIAFLAAFTMAFRAWRTKRVRDLTTRFVASTLLGIAPFIAAMGYYNYRVTGHALCMPYLEHSHQYRMTPQTFFEKPLDVPPFHNGVLYTFYADLEWKEYTSQLTMRGYFNAARARLSEMITYFLDSPALAIFWIALVTAVVRHRAVRRGLIETTLLVAIVFPITHVLTTPWLRVHYLAPWIPYPIALLGVGIRHLWRWRAGNLVIGRWLCFAMLAVYLVSACQDAALRSRVSAAPRANDRYRLIQMLRQQPGEDLVLVHYPLNHNPLFEWVFNDADIDAQPVIFARAMGKQRDEELRDYYRDRKVWHVLVWEDKSADFWPDEAVMHTSSPLSQSPPPSPGSPALLPGKN